jgi:maleate isomerase
VAELERRTGKPVVSSNQASIWASFRALGLTTPIKGYGRLLEQPA